MIRWLKIPRMEILNTPPHKTARCFEAGAVLLDGRLVEFPMGWTTDVTSTPRCLYWLLPQLGGHNSASLLHDRLLDLGWPRDIARHYMALQLETLGDAGEVSRFRRTAMCWGVTAFDFFLKHKSK